METLKSTLREGSFPYLKNSSIQAALASIKDKENQGEALAKNVELNLPVDGDESYRGYNTFVTFKKNEGVWRFGGAVIRIDKKEIPVQIVEG